MKTADDPNTRVLSFAPNPTQGRFIYSRAEADLWDDRKGGGKSCGICWAVAYHTKYNPGAMWLLIRDTWVNMEGTTQVEFFSWFRPGEMGEYSAGRKLWTWRAERIGLTGTVRFMGADDPEDASKIASMPLAGFAIDEASPAAGISVGVSVDIFYTAFMQLRQQGMNWYGAKIAQNSPDETHWTYRMFWDPGTPNMRPVNQQPPQQQVGFKGWRSREPENLQHLPAGYYEGAAALLQREGRTDLVRRLVEGKAGFQKLGADITPEWDDDRHLARGLRPLKGIELAFLYDFGHNPTCLITQVSALGRWLFLKSFVGKQIGMEQLLIEEVKPWVMDHLDEFCRLDRDGKLAGAWRHIGDPAGEQREQSNIENNAVAVIRKALGGRWTPGPTAARHRYSSDESALRAVLRRNVVGGAVVQVDREQATHVWHALRGGWHRKVHPGGVIGDVVKNEHSHPGDAAGYGAAVLFPLSKIGDLVRDTRSGGPRAKPPSWFSGDEKIARIGLR